MSNAEVIQIAAGILFLGVCLPLYLMPSILGRSRRNHDAIFWVNLLAGWSVVGWIVALIWALTSDREPVGTPELPILRIIVGLDSLGLLLLLTVVFIEQQRPSESSNDSPPAHSTGLSAEVMSSQRSANCERPTEVVSPYDLSKNPYRWRGHCDILDTTHVPMVVGNGLRMGYVSYPGGALSFNKMLDEGTAVYEVMAAGEEVEPQGEIAVGVTDSNPPDSGRPWRVFVEGPMDAVNGLGTTITLTKVRFDGYYSPPQAPPQSALPGTTPAQPTQTGAQSLEPAASKE